MDGLADSNGNNANSHIPDYLIIEVLSRLPDKTLGKFMCVSKSWRNLISNSLPPSPMSGLLLSGLSASYRKLPDSFIPLLPSGSNCWEALQSHCTSLRTCHPKITVIHYCNGLFLLSDDAREFGKSYYLCNPATNQCVALPLPPPSSVSCSHQSALIFDPRKSIHYKVLRSGRYFDLRSNQVEVQIFSSDKNQWVSFSAYFQKCIFGSRHFLDWGYRIIYLNGTLHFLCNLGLCMISFCVEEKRFREFELPRTVGGLLTECLGESGGRLYYVACHYDKLEIWMLRSLDPDKWFEKRTLHIANLGKTISPDCYDIMSFHPNLEVLFINQGGVIFSCYFGSGRKDIDRLEKVCSMDPNLFVRFASPYSRCLVPLKDVCNRRSS